MIAHRIALLSFALAGAASAQLPNASPAATSLGGAYTARARGYDAVAWNPANLGLSSNPHYSVSMLALHGSSGLDPISLSDLAPYSGKVLPAAQREAWLQTVAASGGQNGRVDGGLTAIALSAGPFALQVSGVVAGSTKLNADAFEAIMFGNAGRTGSAQNMNLQGSTFRVGVFTTAGLSYGVSFGGENQRFAIGATGKYVVGHALGIAQDDGSTLTTNGVAVSFPMVYSHRSDLIIGQGMGADVGLAYTAGRFSLGATVQNAVNTFVWDETKLYAKSGTAIFDGNTSNTDFDDKPYLSAPTSLRQKVADDKFLPIVAGGIALDIASSLVFSADFRQQLGDGLLLGPKTHAGAGLEFRGIPAVSLRGGASYVTDGWGISAGAGFHVGVAEIGVGGAVRMVNGGLEPVVTLNLFSFR